MWILWKLQLKNHFPLVCVTVTVASFAGQDKYVPSNLYKPKGSILILISEFSDLHVIVGLLGLKYSLIEKCNTFYVFMYRKKRFGTNQKSSCSRVLSW